MVPHPFSSLCIRDVHSGRLYLLREIKGMQTVNLVIIFCLFCFLWALHVQYAYCMLAWSSRIENRRCGSEVVGRICSSSEAVINGCGGTLLEWLLAKEKKRCPLLTNLNGLPGCPRR